MTQTQQQRLLGAGLLLLLICGIALYLLNRVHESHQALNDQEEPLAIASLVEPNNTQVEVFSEPDGEALVDPEALGEAAADQGLQNKLTSTPAKQSTAPATKPAPIASAPTETKPATQPPVEAKATPPTKPAVAAPNASSPWLIQLASFSVKSYAEAMVSKLSELGYSAFIEPSKVNDKTIYRVRLYAGDKQAAEKLAQTVGKQLQLKAQVFQN